MISVAQPNADTEGVHIGDIPFVLTRYGEIGSIADIKVFEIDFTSPSSVFQPTPTNPGAGNYLSMDNGSELFDRYTYNAYYTLDLSTWNSGKLIK